MQKDPINELFDDLKGQFDVEAPKLGHQQRFLDKLNAPKHNDVDTSHAIRMNWRPFIAIAASIIICLSIFISIPNNPENMDLASVSPELSNTQDFFMSTIDNELKKINEERSPLTEKIIDDALNQLQQLEDEYQNLKIDLAENNEDQRVIYAMISNFQNRIEVLNTVLEQIENVKQLKSNFDENNNTI